MKKLFFILFVLLLTSCSYNEPNDIAYVVAVGFDKAKNNTYDITIQFAKPKQISGGASEEGGKGGDIVENITIEAPNVYSGINVANNILSKKFTLSHAKLVVFSQEVATDGVEEIVDTMIRSEALRPDVYIAVSTDDAREYLENVKPIIEVNPAKYYQLIYERSDGGGVPKTDLQQFYFDTKTGTNCSVVPIAGITKSKDGEEGQSGGNGEEEKKPQKNENNKDAPINERSFEKDVKNYRAGEVAIYNSNKSEAMGMALFRNNKLVSILGGIDSELYNMLTGKLNKSYISFENSLSNMPITLKLNQRRRPSFDIDLKKKEVNIGLYLESDIYSIPTNYDSVEQIEDIEAEARESINTGAEEFIRRCQEKYGFDVLHLGNKIKSKFLTLKSYEDYDFKNHFTDFKINVETDMEIRRSGLILIE